MLTLDAQKPGTGLLPPPPPPTGGPGSYQNAFDLWQAQFPYIHYWGAWNEPDNHRVPTGDPQKSNGQGPELAAKYWEIAQRRCASKGCTAIAGEFTGEGYYGISVLSLRTGRVVRQLDTGVPSATQTAAAGAGPSSTQLSGVGPTTTVVLKPDAAVAWIVHDILAPDPPTYQVWKADAGGAPTMLATANDIDPASLALAGSTLYWSQGGAAHAATLS